LNVYSRVAFLIFKKLKTCSCGSIGLKS